MKNIIALQALKRGLEIRTGIDIIDFNEFVKWVENQPKDTKGKTIIDINEFVLSFKNFKKVVDRIKNKGVI